MLPVYQVSYKSMGIGVFLGELINDRRTAKWSLISYNLHILLCTRWLAHGKCEVSCAPVSGYKTPTFTRFGLMPQGAPCPGILDRMDLKDWPRRQGYSAGCLDGYCQVIFFNRICTLPLPSLACDTYIYRYYFTTFIWSWNLLQALNTQFFKIKNELKFFFQ